MESRHYNQFVESTEMTNIDKEPGGLGNEPASQNLYR